MARPDVAAFRSSFKEPHELLRTSDGKVLFVRHWEAKSEPKATILIFHGITAYSGPYGQIIAEQLANSGYDVFGLDLRGHGLSDGKRGDYPSRERFVSDLKETVSFVRAKSRKLVLLGHSLGALTAVAAMNSSPKEIDGLVLLSAARKVKPGVYPKPKTSALLKTLIGIALLRGSPLIEYRREGMVGLNDPLFNFAYSARFYTVLYGVAALSVVSMLRSGDINSPNLKFNAKLQIPLLVGVGDHDELFTVESAKEFCNGLDCDDREFLVVPGAHHATFPKDSWGPLVAWLERKF
jgi:acylglycerol lipase